MKYLLSGSPIVEPAARAAIAFAEQLKGLQVPGGWKHLRPSVAASCMLGVFRARAALLAPRSGAPGSASPLAAAGTALTELDRASPGESTRLISLALLTAARAEDPDDAEQRRSLALALEQAAVSAARRGETDEALASLSEAVDVWRELLAREPGSCPALQGLQWSGGWLARIRAALEDETDPAPAEQLSHATSRPSQEGTAAHGDYDAVLESAERRVFTAWLIRIHLARERYHDAYMLARGLLGVPLENERDRVLAKYGLAVDLVGTKLTALCGTLAFLAGDLKEASVYTREVMGLIPEWGLWVSPKLEPGKGIVLAFIELARGEASLARILLTELATLSRGWSRNAHRVVDEGDAARAEAFALLVIGLRRAGEDTAAAEAFEELQELVRPLLPDPEARSDLPTILRWLLASPGGFVDPHVARKIFREELERG
jgi:tetratricopeptide (TPR) repeat protein